MIKTGLKNRADEVVRVVGGATPLRSAHNCREAVEFLSMKYSSPIQSLEVSTCDKILIQLTAYPYNVTYINYLLFIFLESAILRNKP